MLNPVIYSFTVKKFKKSAIQIIIPIWKFMHNIFPSAIKKPSKNQNHEIIRNIASRRQKNKCANNKFKQNNTTIYNSKNVNFNSKNNIKKNTKY